MNSPEHWDSVFLQRVADVRSGLSKSSSRQGQTIKKPYLRVANVQDGFVDLSEIKEIDVPISQVDRFTLRSGDLLLIEGNGNPENLGRGCIWKGQIPDCVHQNHVFAVRTLSNAGLLAEFLMLQLQSRRGRNYLLSCAKTSTGLSTLNSQQLKQFPVLIPPLPEQRKIAEILRNWDEALEKLNTLRAAKERRLGALRTALLFGSLRLKGLRHKWTPTRLETVSHELTKRNGAKGLGREHVMGVTKAEGIVPMREQTIAGDISRYKRLPPHAFAYNPMRINVGSIAMNERDEEVLVSPDYVVFACNVGGLDPDYLDHLRKTSWWSHYINRGGSGSVRQRTYYDDLATLKLPLPDLDEQKEIVAVLNTARDDLTATEREIDALTHQKRGLMQNLLTGEWRLAAADQGAMEAEE